MQNSWYDRLTQTFSVELPNFQAMDDYIDYILPNIRAFSEDLYETEYYMETRWLEIRDDDSFVEAVLHIFRDKGEYLQSIDGNIVRGNWQLLETSNTLILNQMAGGSIARSELYDLVFLNPDFFILKKHGDQQRRGQRKYLVLANEIAAAGLEWREVMELLFNLHRGNSSSFTSIVIFLVVLALAVVLFSIW